MKRAPVISILHQSARGDLAGRALDRRVPAVEGHRRPPQKTGWGQRVK